MRSAPSLLRLVASSSVPSSAYILAWHIGVEAMVRSESASKMGVAFEAYDL